MIIKELELRGVFEIRLSPHFDERGFFTRTFDDETFRETQITRSWVQENQSHTFKSGTIRGLHFQFPPFSETKLIRVLNGKILDVIVDLRLESETFGEWKSIELSRDNNKLLLVPRGFAHGFCTLVDNCDVFYKVDNVYSPEYESGIRWDDDTLNIRWPIGNPIVSSKDNNLLTFEEFVANYKGIGNF